MAESVEQVVPVMLTACRTHEAEQHFAIQSMVERK
jgi:hypothetical protein